MFKVADGEGAGNVHLYASFKDFNQASHSASVLIKDPEMAAWQAAREAEPASHMRGPEVYRAVFGKPSVKPVILQRDYKISRGNVTGALALMPELKAVSGDTPIMAVLPTVAADMDRMSIAYYFDSPEHFGMMFESVGMSPAFQEIVIKASALGTLKHARLLVAID